MADKLNRDLGRLTPGEELFLWRLERGLSQPAAARLLGVSRSSYQRLEGGRRPSPVSLGRKPTLAEQCRLARRRAGWGHRQTARTLGVLHVYLNELERTANLKIIAFWKNEGFTFSFS